MPVVVLSARTVSITPTSGGLGTVVSVTGTNFDPTAAVTVRGVQNLTGPVNSTDAPVAASIGATGNLAATNYTISDPLTLAVLVAEDAPDGDPAADNASAGYTTQPGVATIDSITGQRTGVNGAARPGRRFEPDRQRLAGEVRTPVRSPLRSVSRMVRRARHLPAPHWPPIRRATCREP